MLFMPAGIYICVSAGVFAKQLFGIAVKFSERRTYLKDVHPLNAEAPRSVQPSGIYTAIRFVKPCRVSAKTFFMVDGKIMILTLVLSPLYQVERLFQLISSTPSGTISLSAEPL